MSKPAKKPRRVVKPETAYTAINMLVTQPIMLLWAISKTKQAVFEEMKNNGWHDYEYRIAKVRIQEVKYHSYYCQSCNRVVKQEPSA